MLAFRKRNAARRHATCRVPEKPKAFFFPPGWGDGLYEPPTAGGWWFRTTNSPTQPTVNDPSHFSGFRFELQRADGRVQAFVVELLDDAPLTDEAVEFLHERLHSWLRLAQATAFGLAVRYDGPDLPADVRRN